MHDGCVLWGGVGAGKTITALAYALKAEPDKKIVIVTTAKVRDSGSWEDEAATIGVQVKNFEITSWNKINDLVDYEDCFFIFDEQRLVGSGAWVKAFYKIAKKNKWILLTATPGDTWADYGPMFVAHGWYKNITEFRQQHAVYSSFTKYPKIVRWLNESKLQKYRSQLLVKMPMERHTTRHIHHIECSYDQELLDTVRKRRWNIYKDEPIRNAAELYGVMRKVVSTDPSRIWEIRKLLKTHPKLIIFYNYNYELDILREICTDLENTKDKDYSWLLKEPNTSSTATETTSIPQPQVDSADGQSKSATTKKPGAKQLGKTPTSSEKSIASSAKKQASLRETSASFSWAEWNGHKHEPLPTTSSWIYLVQYSSGSEGWNCIETDSMAFWSLTYSWKQFHQAQGRIDRLNTPFTDLHYYVLMTNSVAEKPVMQALEQKKDFQPR